MSDKNDRANETAGRSGSGGRMKITCTVDVEDNSPAKQAIHYALSALLQVGYSAEELKKAVLELATEYAE